MKTVLFTMVMFVALCFASCSNGNVKSSATANDTDTVQVDSVDSINTVDSVSVDSVVTDSVK